MLEARRMELAAALEEAIFQRFKESFSKLPTEMLAVLNTAPKEEVQTKCKAVLQTYKMLNAFSFMPEKVSLRSVLPSMTSKSRAELTWI